MLEGSFSKIKKRRVALLIETTRSYGRRIMDGIADYLQENRPWQIFVQPRALNDPIPQWLNHWRGDGVIARGLDENTCRQIEASGIPVVNLKGASKNSLFQPDFSTDRVAVGRMAAEHFIQRQYTRFGFVGLPGMSWSEQEQYGFIQRLAESGLTCNVFEHKSTYTLHPDGAMDEEIDALEAWLRSLAAPVGILAADDFLGVQLLSACYNLEIKVPEMVSIIGVGDEGTVSRMTSPTLSSVRPNEALLGRKAAELLDKLMNGEKVERKTILIPPSGISERHSSDTFAVEDLQVMRALAFIRENVAHGVNAADIVRFIGVSKSQIQRKFQTLLNHSIYDVIIDYRIRLVKEYLKNTQISLCNISKLSGFKYNSHMNSLFKLKTGMTPAEYREEEV